MKKFLSILLVTVLILSLAPTVFADGETPIFHYVAGDTTNGIVSRNTNKKWVTMVYGNAAPWGAKYYDTDSDGEKNEIEISSTHTGNEGVLAPSALPSGTIIGGETLVYWMRSADFPEGDKGDFLTAYASSSSGVWENYQPYGADDVYVGNDSSMPAFPTELSGKFAWEATVRFDDYNATRSMFRIFDEESKYTNMLIFGTDGQITINIKGSNDIYVPYSPGEWYNVKLIYDFSDDSFDVYINGVCYAYNQTSQKQYATETAAEGKTNAITSVHFLNVTQENKEVTQRTFSNSYMYEAKAYVPVNDFIVNSEFIHPTSSAVDNGSLPVTTYRNWSGKSAYAAITIPDKNEASKYNGGEQYIKYEGFEGLNNMYMMQSWNNDKENGLYSTGFDFSAPAYKDIVLNTKVRFEDYKSATWMLVPREIFALDTDADAAEKTQMIVFNTDGKIMAKHISNAVAAETAIGTWQLSKWYDVKAVIHTEDNLYDVYVNGTLLAENLYLGMSAKQIKTIYYLYQNSADVGGTSTLFSQYAKVYYDKESTYQSPQSHYKFEGFKKLNTESGAWENASELSNGKYAVEIDLLNNDKDSEAMSPAFIFALYNGNRLVSVQYEKASTAYPANFKARAEIDVNLSSPGNWALKAFVMNGASLAPMSAEFAPITTLSQTVAQ